jgi:hypothetical protein
VQAGARLEGTPEIPASLVRSVDAHAEALLELASPLQAVRFPIRPTIQRRGCQVGPYRRYLLE